MASSAAEQTDGLIAKANIMVFSKTYCPYCTRAKEAIGGLYKYEVVELDTMGKQGDEIQAYLLTKTGQRTVPNIFVKGKHIGGCDATLAAISSGEFQKLAN
jgi:glutaredoxin 3